MINDAAQHLDALAVAAAALADRAANAGLTAAVPTCPLWTVADLVAHQGVVHRWAASNLRLDDAQVPSDAEVLETVPGDRLLFWFADGAAELLDAFAAAPPDVAAMVFLNDAPPPRAFWARRQAHETTMHAVDALAAALGRYPSAAEAGIDAALAVDGIDELLRGFFTRGPSRLVADRPLRIAVRPTDADAAWLLHVRTEGMVTDRIPADAVGAGTDAATSDAAAPSTAAPDLEIQPDPPAQPDAVFSGTAAQLYLGLWNRGTEIDAAGCAEVLERWHEVQRVGWS